MATPRYNTYVGMRYVPIFDGEWDRTKTYEPLVIVSNQGNSYTSRTFVPTGVDITNTTYWALTGNYNAQVEYYRQETQRVSDILDYFLIPDVSYSGSDTQKLQSCLDELQTTGGVIVINRKYTLTDNLIDKLKTDATNKKSIIFLGVGKEAMIDMGQWSFVSDLSDASVGGLRFIGIDFEGTGRFANTNKLIRLFFTECRFRGFDYVIYGEGTTQTIYFNQCYFEDIGEWVMTNTNGGIWDIKFSQCVCENSSGFYNGDLDNLAQGNYNIIIDSCCIEGIDGSAIVPSGNTMNFTITNCYFESCQPINLEKCGGVNALGFDISNNTFFLSSGISAIKMPYQNASLKFHGYIKNNVCNPATNYLCSVSQAINYVCRYQIVGNTGALDSANNYATYEPVYGEVITLSGDNVTGFDAGSDVVIDDTRDYRKAISISIIYAATAGSFRDPGTFVYVRHTTGALVMHIGEQAIMKYSVKVVMPTN